jgi:hypothetical protein
MVLSAIATGVILIARRGSKVASLVFGILLIIVSLVALFGTVFIHLFLHATVKSVEKVMAVKNIKTTLGVPATVGEWRITVSSVREASYINCKDDYFGAEIVRNIIVVTLKIRGHRGLNEDYN